MSAVTPVTLGDALEAPTQGARPIATRLRILMLLAEGRGVRLRHSQTRCRLPQTDRIPPPGLPAARRARRDPARWALDSTTGSPSSPIPCSSAIADSRPSCADTRRRRAPRRRSAAEANRLLFAEERRNHWTPVLHADRRANRSRAVSGSARSGVVAAPAISIRNYAIVTAAYWAFTLTDGALRMLVLLHFQRARLHARTAGVSVPALRVLRHRHEPRRRLGGGADGRAVHAGSGPGDSGRRARRCSRC